MAAMAGIAGRGSYAPPSEHVIVNTGTGALALRVGTHISAEHLADEVAKRACCDARSVRLLEGSHAATPLKNDQLVPAGAILQLLGGPVLCQAPRRNARRGSASDEPLPLAALFACGFIDSFPAARKRWQEFEHVAEATEIPVGELLSAVGAISRAARKSVANRSQHLPRLQVSQTRLTNPLDTGFQCVS